MYEVLDKDTIKSEILPHLSGAKRGYVSQSDLVEVIQCILYKLKTGCQWHMLPVSSFFTGRVLHYKTVYGHFRKWSKMVNGRRCGASFCTVIGLSWTCPAWNWTAATPLPFAVGSAVAIKDARKGRRSMPFMSRTAKEYRLPCPLSFRVRTTMFTTSLKHFLNCFRGL